MKTIEIKLLKAYSGASRFYHGTDHVLEMLDLFHNNTLMDGLPDPGFRLKESVKSVSNVHMAILAHDAVYNPWANNNEEESAEFYKELCHPGEHLDSVVEMILATKHHTVSDTERFSDKALMLSVDLASLACNSKTFDLNSYNISREFAPYYTNETIVSKQLEFFRSYLEREYIFPHAQLEEAWGEVARDNIARKIYIYSIL